MAGWRTGPADVTFTVDEPLANLKRLDLSVVVVRGGVPVGVGDGLRVESLLGNLVPVPDLPLPAVDLTSGRLALAFLHSQSLYFFGNTFTDVPPTSTPTDFSPVNPAGSSQIRVYQSDDDVAFPAGGHWSFGNSRYLLVQAALTVLFETQLDRIWDPGNPVVIPVAPNRSIVYEVSANRPFASVATANSPGDYEVSGSVTATATIHGVNARWTLEGGPSGGTATLKQLRGQFLDGGGEQVIEAEDPASIATHGVRPVDPDIWPYMTPAEGQLLANQYVQELAQPRRSWAVQLDGDRNAATMAASIDPEIGERIRCYVDSMFDHDGELLGVDHQISGPAGLLETNLRFLAAETVAPQPIRLYLGSTANPLFLGSAANPMFLR